MSWVKDNFFGGNEQAAAQDQIRAGDRAIASQEAAREQARADLQPFAGAGASIINPLLDFALDAPTGDLERTRGFEDIQRSAAAGGKLRSGGALESLTQFNSMLNERNRNNRFSELFNIATLGSNAAAGQATATLSTADNVGNIQIGQGNASAAGIIGAGNATKKTLFDVGRIIAGGI